MIVPKRIDAGGGIIRFPFWQANLTMDAARDMIHDWGWRHESEGGDDKEVTFQATDQNGKGVSFRFLGVIVGTRVLVSTGENPQYSVEEITKELTRRIGMCVDGSPLPTVRNAGPNSRPTE